MLITIITSIFVFSKTPIYEVSSVIKIASVNNVIIEDSELLSKKIKLIYNVEDKEVITKDNGIVSKVSITKNVPNFIEISTQAFSNKTALEKNREVLKFIQDEYKYKIDEYKELVTREIYNLNKQIEYIKNIDLVNLKEKIKFLNEVDLVSLNNKLVFNNSKLTEYQSNINKISKRKSSNDTQNMLSAMEILNNQNLILNLQDKIEDLNKEKKSLIREKLRNLKSNINTKIPNKILNLEYKIEQEKSKMNKNKLENSNIIGKIKVYDKPVKPKKLLIIIVSFITSLIMAVFLVFLLNFISNNKTKKEEFN